MINYLIIKYFNFERLLLITKLAILLLIYYTYNSTYLTTHGKVLFENILVNEL